MISTNTTWVWCPNLQWSTSVPYSQLYPGDGYVDWTCLDGYNMGGNSESFSNLYTASYKSLLAVAPEIAWTQAAPQPSLGLIEKFAHGRDASIIDVGGGASLLVDHLLERGQPGLNRIAQSILGISAAPRQPLAERFAKVHLIEDRFGPDRGEPGHRISMVGPAKGLFKRIEIARNAMTAQGHAGPRGDEQVGPARRKQLAQIEQTLAQACLGVGFESTGPQQLAQKIAVDRFAVGKAQHRQQCPGPAVRDDNLAAICGPELKSAEQRYEGRVLRPV